MLRSAVAVALVAASADAFTPALLGLKMQSAEKPAIRCRPRPPPRGRCRQAVLVEWSLSSIRAGGGRGRRMALRMWIVEAVGAKFATG